MTVAQPIKLLEDLNSPEAEVYLVDEDQRTTGAAGNRVILGPDGKCDEVEIL